MSDNIRVPIEQLREIGTKFKRTLHRLASSESLHLSFSSLFIPFRPSPSPLFPAAVSSPLPGSFPFFFVFRFLLSAFYAAFFGVKRRHKYSINQGG